MKREPARMASLFFIPKAVIQLHSRPRRIYVVPRDLQFQVTTLSQTDATPRQESPTNASSIGFSLTGALCGALELRNTTLFVIWALPPEIS